MGRKSIDMLGLYFCKLSQIEILMVDGEVELELEKKSKIKLLYQLR